MIIFTKPASSDPDEHEVHHPFSVLFSKFYEYHKYLLKQNILVKNVILEAVMLSVMSA